MPSCLSGGLCNIINAGGDVLWHAEIEMEKAKEVKEEVKEVAEAEKSSKLLLDIKF